MKKMMSALLLLLFLTGCAGQSVSSAVSAPSEPSLTPSATEPTPNPVPLRPSVREFGTEYAIIDYDSPVSTYLVYPQSGIAEIDNILTAWADETHQTHLAETHALAEKEADLKPSLIGFYDSFLVGDHYASVSEVVDFDHHALAHPVEILKLFNFDLTAKKELTPAEIVDLAKADEIVPLLKAALLADGKLTEEDLAEMNADWLAYPMLKKEGVAFFLPRGEFAAGYLGTMSATVPYEQLGALCLLADLAVVAQAPPPETSTTPPVNPAPSPTTQTPGTDPAIRDLDPNKPMIALTFDDGPSANTKTILALLDQYGGKSTFFVIGNMVASRGDVITSIVAQGSEIGNHSWDHKDLAKLPTEALNQQLTQTNDVIQQISGTRPVLMRPPYGSTNDGVMAASRGQGLAVINWSVDTLDWKTRDATATYNAIFADVKDGSIILCHDIHKPTADAMAKVIPDLVAQGYQLVTVSELLYYRQGGSNPGQLYRSAPPA